MASSRRTGVNEHISTYGAAGMGRDYTTLSAWENATDNDLVTLQQSEVLECYDDAASFDDSVYLSGATTNASYFRIIRAAQGQGHNGTPHSGVTFNRTGDSTVFYLPEAYGQVQDIIGQCNPNSTNNRIVFDCYGQHTAAIGCIAVDSSNAGTGVIAGFHGRNTGGSQRTYIVNCLAHNIEGNGFYGDNGQVRVYNCTATGNGGYGFYATGSGGVTAKNCCSSDNAAGDWSGSNLYKTTCTEEGANPTYVNADGDDFHLAAGDTTCKDQGTDLSADADFAFDDDIDKQTRSGTWDIGFDEYVAAGGLSIPVAQHHYQQQMRAA